jgi:hypothetical protein
MELQRHVAEPGIGRHKCVQGGEAAFRSSLNWGFTGGWLGDTLLLYNLLHSG